jgi:putative ABC transporter-associated repeat protein
MRGGKARHRRLWGIAGVLAIVAGTALAVPASVGQAAQPAPRQILNDVHTDAVYVVYEDGKLDLKTRVGNACCYEYRDPGEVIFQLKDTADSRLAVPDLPAYAFLGTPGTPIWVAPELETRDLVWPGWATEDPSLQPSLFQGGAVDISLVEVAGPGPVEVFASGAVGEPVRMFSSTDPTYKTWRQAVGGGQHTHANWAFTALGAYTLTFEVTATTTEGTSLSTGPVSLTWYVGGTTAADVAPAATSTTLSVSPQTARAGDEVTLTAAVAPRASGWLEFRAGAGSLGRQKVRGGRATLTTSALAAGEHSLTAVYTSDYTNDYLTSTSSPVAYTVSGPTTTPTATPTPTPTPTVEPTSTPNTPATSAPSNEDAPGGSGSGSGGGSSGGSPGGDAAETKCVPDAGPSGASGGGSGGGGVATDAVVLDNGHVDYATRITGGRLQSLVKDGTRTGSTIWREPAKVIFHLKPAAKTTIPAGFGFLGGAGSAIWQIPQTQKQGILWLGWNTEEVSASQAGSGVTWRLDKVTGPGRLAIYEFTTFGQPRVVFNSGDGLPDRYTIPPGTHAHGNWAFTKEGTYRLTFTQSAALASGGTSTDTETVTFAVGDVDPKSAQTGGQSGSVTTESLLMRPVANQGCRLPFTGAALLAPAALGGGLLATGVAVVTVTYRRRRRSSAAVR